MAGGVIILLVLLLIGPVAVMLGGAVWSALMGWLHVDTAEANAAAATADEG